MDRVMALSTTFQLYLGGQVYWWRESEYPEKTELDVIEMKIVNYFYTKG